MKKKAILFLHGFSARDEDNQVFVDYMKKKSKVDFYTFILPGHETKRMGRATYQDWTRASEIKLKEILEQYDKVSIVGHSMGTILAVYLAIHYVQVEKLVLISPAYFYGNLEQNAKDLKKWVRHEINPDLGTGFEGALYKLLHVPFTSFLEYKKLAGKMAKDIQYVKCPTLVLHGIQDNIVPIRSSLYVYNALNCEKHLTLLEDVRHQVFKSKKAEVISHYVYDYIIGGIHFKIKKRDMI